MSQHKYNPTAIKAKNDEIPPKPPRMYKRERDIDTSKLHYVKVPESHIVIDFDIKGGQGIHLHYNYRGS